jgi:hypothetical protein
MVVDIVWFGARLGNDSECSTDLGLGLAYAEDLGSTAWAFTLSSGRPFFIVIAPGFLISTFFRHFIR